MTVPRAYEIDGVPASAAAFIGAACDPSVSVVVEACAGSGKTWLLVARMLRMLLTGCEPATLLAITFTRKAAQEMQERLLALLQELALRPDAEVLQLLRERGIAEAALSRQLPLARQLYARILASPQALSIDTFHSWFARLLQIAPLAAGVPHGYSLTEATGELLTEAGHRFMQAVSTTALLPVRTALEALYAQVGDHQAQRLLDAFVNRRAEWWAATQAGAAPLAVLQTLCGADALTDARLELWDDADLKQRVLQVAALLGQGTATNQKRAQAIEMALSGGPSVEAFAALCHEFFDTTGKARRNTATKALAAALIVAFGSDGVLVFETQFNALGDELAQLEARSHEAGVVALNAALMTAGAAFLDQYLALKAERRVFDFADLEWQVLRLMSSPQHAAYLQSRLDARYRHVLLDEFQDTNPLQWHVVRAWLDAYGDDAERPSVFIVGDPKQSIYRFRRAEPRVFAAAAALLQAQGARQLRTSQTRRNAPAITSVMNQAFAPNPLYFAQTTLAAGAGAVWRLPLARSPATTAASDDIGVDVNVEVEVEVEGNAASRATLRDPLTTARTEEEDARRLQEGIGVAACLLAARIEQAAAGTPLRWSDIMLLVKKRTHLSAYERALREAGIPHVSDRRGGLLESLEVSDLIALLTLLVTPGDDRAVAHVLKSPVFGATDADLVRLAGESAPGWWRRLQAVALHSDCAPALTRAARLLQCWHAAAPGLPVHDLLDLIMAQGELLPRYAQCAAPTQRAQTLGNLQAFIGLSLELDAGRYPSLPKFIAALQALQSNASRDAPDEAAVDAGVDAVRIMTIHSAKGLEAPVVVVLDANHSDPARDDAGILCEWPQDAAAPTHFSGFGRRAERGAARADLFGIEEALKAQEDWNLLYVAATRAQRLLVISGVAATRGADADGVQADSWYARLGMLPTFAVPTPASSAAPGLAAPAFDLKLFLPPQLPPPQLQTQNEAQHEAQHETQHETQFRMQRQPPLQPQSSLIFDSPLEYSGAGPGPGLALEPAAATPMSSQRSPVVQAAVDEGILLHALMERITLEPSWPVTVPAPALVARWLACPVAAAAEICAQAACILAQPALQQFFDPARFLSADNECELVVSGAVVRIDRLVQHADGFWILDYKRSVDSADLPAYAAQLGAYRRAMFATGCRLPIKTALISADGRLWCVD